MSCNKTSMNTEKLEMGLDTRQHCHGLESHPQTHSRVSMLQHAPLKSWDGSGDEDVQSVNCLHQPTFDTKGWSLRRLPNTGKHILLQATAKCLCQANSSCTLSFAKGSGRHSSHHNISGKCINRIINALSVHTLTV